MASRIFFSDSLGDLYRVDPLSASLDATRIGSMPQVMTDIALSPNGKLYGITFSGVYTINAATAETTFISAHNLAGANALFITPDNTAYTASFIGGGIYRINLTTGVATRLPQSDTQYASAGDITMLNGELILATTDNKLVRINPDTGATLGVVTHGISSLFGITTIGNDLYGVASGNLWKLNALTGATELQSSYNIFSIFGAGVSDYGQSGAVRNGTAASEVLLGTASDDIMFGQAGNDVMRGGNGKDQIFGGAGNDRVVGGFGLDKLYGGAGNDQFVFANLAESATGRADVMYDFRNGDRCNLSQIDANANRAGNNAFVIDAGGGLLAGEIKLTFNSSGTRVDINTDGDAAFEMTLFARGIRLDAGDFIL
jgi:Ca2+-binding RTX toxin-like protein